MDQEKVWDEIAEQWHHFRQQKFMPVYDFIEKYNPQKGKILEIGCGNCRNLIPFAKKGFECYGIDFSQNMVKFAEDLAYKNDVKIRLSKEDMTTLSFEDNYFDYILHIASLHHLGSENNIINAIQEAYRVLKPGGLMLLTVWNKFSLRFIAKSKEVLIPWKKKGAYYHRYYHLFDYFELKKLLKLTNFKLVESNIFGRNLVFVLKK